MKLSVPWIRRGKGDTPEDGGCIMQIVDWVSTGGWTDRPACVAPDVCGSAVAFNDAADDEHRQQLLGLIPKMMYTAGRRTPKQKRLLEQLATRMQEKFIGVSMDGWALVFEEWLDEYNEIIGNTPGEMPDLSGVSKAMSGASA